MLRTTKGCEKEAFSLRRSRERTVGASPRGRERAALLSRAAEMPRRSPPLSGMKCPASNGEFRWNHGQCFVRPEPNTGSGRFCCAKTQGFEPRPSPPTRRSGRMAPKLRTRNFENAPGHQTKRRRNHEKHRKDDGQDRCPVQEPRLCVPRQRDLRRPCQHLGLRPARRGAEEEHQERLVEEVRAGESLQRRPRRGDPDESPDLGRERPSERLLRSSDGLPRVPRALPRG